MTGLEAILFKLIERAIEMLIARGKKRFAEHEADVALDLERGEVNAKNLNAYNKEKNRLRRVENALKLINRTRSS